MTTKHPLLLLARLKQQLGLNDALQEVLDPEDTLCPGVCWLYRICAFDEGEGNLS